MKLLILSICFVLWIYFLWVTKRAKLKFGNYIIGSVGMFIFMIIILQPILTGPMTKVIAIMTGELGDLTGMYDSYYEYGMLFIPKSTAAVSLYIDFECSGIIEIFAYLSLLWFFNIYNVYQKIFLSFAGIFLISIFNVIRIFVICFMIYLGGNDVFFFAHSIAGRLVFYIMSVTLYFYVFTRAHIIAQKVGVFRYDK